MGGPWPGDENPKNLTGSEMLLRWIQFGVFSPILRTHCEPSCDRYVWEFPHFEEMRAALRLRDALVPYIYSHGFEAVFSGVSLLRPMYYQWPNEDKAYVYSGQYMFGRTILVAPITERADDSNTAPKSVWLPPNTDWVDFLTGGQTQEKDRWQLQEVPVFVTAGAVVPLRTPASTYSGFVDPLVIAAWTGASKVNKKYSGKFELHEDAGDGLDYMQGGAASSHTKLTFESDATRLLLAVHPTKGSFAGQRERRNTIAQFRGVSQSQVKDVFVNEIRGRHKREVDDAYEGPVWYFAERGSDARDTFTEPEGTLVVNCGELRLRTFTEIYIALNAHSAHHSWDLNAEGHFL